MGRLRDLDDTLLARMNGPRSDPRLQAFARKYGWTFFLLLAVVTLAHAIWYGRHYGMTDPIGYGEAGIFIAASAFAFFRLRRR